MRQKGLSPGNFQHKRPGATTLDTPDLRCVAAFRPTASQEFRHESLAPTRSSNGVNAPIALPRPGARRRVCAALAASPIGTSGTALHTRPLRVSEVNGLRAALG